MIRRSIEIVLGSFGQPIWSANGRYCWQGRSGSEIAGTIDVVVVGATVVVVEVVGGGGGVVGGWVRITVFGAVSGTGSAFDGFRPTTATATTRIDAPIPAASRPRGFEYAKEER